MFEGLKKAVEANRVPGAVGAWVTREGVKACKAFGFRMLEPEKLPMERNTLFDVASLTKVVVTTTLLCILLEKDKICLEDPAAKYLPEFDTEEKRKILIQHLIPIRPAFPGGSLSSKSIRAGKSSWGRLPIHPWKPLPAKDTFIPIWT